MNARFYLDDHGPAAVVYWAFACVLLPATLIIAIGQAVMFGSVSSSWLHAIVWLQLAVLLPLPIIQLGGLMHWSSLLRARAAPLRDLPHQVNEAISGILLAWLAMLVVDALLVWLCRDAAATGAIVIGHMALLSLATALVTLAYAAWRGVLRREWLWLLVVFVSWAQWQGGWSIFDSLPAGAALVLLCLLPITLAWVAAPLKTSQFQLQGHEAPQEQYRRWNEQFDRRMTLIEVQSTGVITQNIIVLSMLNSNVVIFGYWGDGVSAWYVTEIAMLGAMANGYLRCKDLHWRNLLTPNGLDRRHLASSTLQSTLAGLLPAMVIFAILGIDWGRWVEGLDWSQALRRVALNGVSLGGDVLLATSLAVLVRGWLPSGNKAMWFWACVLVAGFPLTLALAHPAKPPVLWHRDWAHFWGSLAVGCIVTLWANRVWARTDLWSLLRHKDRLATELKRQ